MPRLLAHLHLPDGLPQRMMAAWHRCRAMSGASTARSQHGAASRNAWRRGRDFPSGCGGLHTAVRITARRPAKRCLRDIGWPSVTAARLTPRSLSRCHRRCPPLLGECFHCFPENVPADAKPCQVLSGGVWVDGFLLEWQRGADGRWKGLVNYRHEAGRRVALKDQAELRPAGSPRRP